jgi:hypothetical protein
MARDRTNENAAAHAAWELLPEEWRRAIAEFCLRSDRDVAIAAMKIRSV